MGPLFQRGRIRLSLAWFATNKERGPQAHQPLLVSFWTISVRRRVVRAKLRPKGGAMKQTHRQVDQRVQAARTGDDPICVREVELR